MNNNKREFLRICTGEKFDSKIVQEDMLAEEWAISCYGSVSECPKEELESARERIADEGNWTYDGGGEQKTTWMESVGEVDSIQFVLITHS